MTEKEKKLKIEKIEKYSAEWHDNNDYLKFAYKTGFVALVATFLGVSGLKELFGLSGSSDAYAINSIVTGLTVAGSYSSVISLKGAIQGICEKIKLEKKIDELNEALEQIPEEKEIGRGGR